MDTPRWNLNNKGMFSVKSLYNHINNDANVEIKWSRIWNMKTTPAVKIFIWKVAHSILPNSMRVAAILPDIDTTCKLCNESRETLSHMFLHCNYATQVWMHFNFSMEFIRNGTKTFHEWLTNCFDNPKRGEYDIDWPVLCRIIIWTIWKVRCDVVFKKKFQNSIATSNKIITFISYNTVTKTGHNIMEELYYNSRNDDVLQINKNPILENGKNLALHINIAPTIAYSSMRAGIDLTLIDHTCTIREARGFYIESRSIEELERAGADAAFQWETCWSGHIISFKSDSEPTLVLLVGMYAEARIQRYLISEDYGNTRKFETIFLVQDFNLVRSTDVF
ncbi:uncharacterized protein LOC113339581 [Papaver somniferum]|uniref:uncharacterized protein LOC113339581 n=1 Tax=Papaver somniferum TaxID=3469 RepID=UPI000E705AE9|nr:uncharacterized protein LOC113339581 [Papaver somniferum]